MSETMLRKCIVFLSALCVFQLSGCVSMRVPTRVTHFQKIAPQQRKVALSKMTQWKINGALSIVQVNQQPEIANYQWRQLSAQDYHIVLSSALNLYRVVIDAKNNVVTLSKNGAYVTSAKTPEKLLQQAVGWSLPVRPLQYWIKGMPAPKQPYVAKYDQYGHILVLQQAGWTLHYETYQTEAGIDLPQMITLQRPQLYVKIVIKNWK